MNQHYQARGVSAAKEDVHAAIRYLDQGLFRHTFCKIYPDFLGNDAQWVNLIHSDGSGTKSILAYLYWKETGDASVWRGISQDVVVMNLDDMLCAGAEGSMVFTSLINRNKHLIPGEVLREIIEGNQAFFHWLHSIGIEVHYLGGETADLGDSVRTITVDGSMACRFPRNRVIDMQHIAPGDVIVGFASDGQTSYESVYNSGIGSNGLTSARHDLLKSDYGNLYPETVDPKTSPGVVYQGPYALSDPLEGTPLNVGQALLSPTRTYAPLIRQLREACGNSLHGLVHCTGGGQTKILHYIDNLKVVKNQLPQLPPIFELIRTTSNVSWKELYQVFNAGIRLEAYLHPSAVEAALEAAKHWNIDAYVIGHVEQATHKEVSIHAEGGWLNYTL